jgi:O-antigen/teichoic acid export membrane protein
MTLGKKVIRASVLMIGSGYLIVIISFIGNLALARILLPQDFGTYALAHAVLSFIFMLAGFGSQEAIVQNRDRAEDALIPTAFWISFALALALAMCGSLVALLVADLYPAPVPLFILVLSWVHFVGGVANTYSAVLNREMAFRHIAALRFSTTLMSFVVAAIAAALGAGAWALIVRDAVHSILGLLGYIRASRYQLAFAFDWGSASWIWKFGWRMMISRISEVIFGQLDNWVVGTLMGSQTLGHYSLAYRLNLLGHQLTQSAIQPVLFSTFAHLQDSPERIQRGFNRVMYWLTRSSLLLTIGVLVVGQSLVTVVYGQQWSIAGAIFQSMWLFLGLLPIHESVKNILIGINNINSVVNSRLIMLAFFIPSLVVTALTGNIFAVVWVVNLSLLLSTGLMFFKLSRLVRIEWTYLIRNPFVAALVTIAFVAFTQQNIGTSLSFLDVVVRGLQVVLTYGGVLLLLEYATIRTEFNAIRSSLL